MAFRQERAVLVWLNGSIIKAIERFNLVPTCGLSRYRGGNTFLQGQLDTQSAHVDLQLQECGNVRTCHWYLLTRWKINARSQTEQAAEQ